MVLFWHPIRRLLTLSRDTFLLTVRRWNVDVEMQAVFRLPFQLGLNPSEKLEAFPGHPFQSGSDVGNVWKRLGADGTRLHGWPHPRPVHGGPRRREPETKSQIFTLCFLGFADSFITYSQPFGQLGLRPEVQPTLRVPLRGLASPKA